MASELWPLRGTVECGLCGAGCGRTTRRVPEIKIERGLEKSFNSAVRLPRARERAEIRELSPRDSALGSLSRGLLSLDSTGPVYTHRTPTLSTLAKSGLPILAHANSAYGTATDRTVIKHEFGFRLAHICR